MSIIFVCFSLPTRTIAPGSKVLSFLSPADERQLERTWFGDILRGRLLLQKVQEKARGWYIDAVSSMGVAPVGTRSTWRQTLPRYSGVSAWWFHPVAAKNCEYDPTFEYMLYLCAILDVLETEPGLALELVGAPAPLAAVLKGAGLCRSRHFWRRMRGLSWSVLRGVAHRVFKWLREMALIGCARICFEARSSRADMLLAGYWNWSVRFDPETGSMVDRYFAALPDEMWRRGCSCGWMVWLDPRTFGSARGMMCPAPARKSLCILQQFVSLADCVKAFLDFRPLGSYLGALFAGGFRKAFRSRGFDLFPLFEGPLLQGFLDWSLPHARLVSLAVDRSCRQAQPRLLLTFQEHFLHSRAIYAGARSGEVGPLLATVQHASYNHNKVYLFYDPRRDFLGEPDDCPAPRPDLVFAMGLLGKELFLECGYAERQVLVTGSPRYDGAIRVAGKLPEPRQGQAEPFVVLLVCSLELQAEFDMVEAVVLAMEGLEGFELRLRSHPDKKIELEERFQPFAPYFHISRQTLSSDIESADLLLYTQTTVAEEAFLQGKRVWQWLPRTNNASALAEVAVIPQFGSIKDLALKLARVRQDPYENMPSLNKLQQGLEQLFYKDDGQAAWRIAEHCAKLISVTAKDAIDT